MDLLIVTQYFPPEIGAAASRWSDYARILAGMNHNITILCELPNYPSGVIAEGYPKYWFMEERDEDTNIRIVRVPIWANQRKTTIQRIGFYLSFMLSATIRTLFLPKYDAIIVSSPPLFVGVIAGLIKPFKKSKYILDLRDIWPESAAVLGEIKSKPILQLGRSLERFVYNSADAFLLAVPGFRSYLETHHPRQNEKKKFNLMNGVSQHFMNMLSQGNPGVVKKTFRVLFSGNMGLAQGLETVLKAAEILKEEEIDFVFIGDGAKRSDLEHMRDKNGLERVSFIPSMARSSLVQEIQDSDVCLVPLINSPLFLNAIPSKLLEYMAAGKPPIVGIRGEVEVIVEQSGCGICIEPENEQSLAESILQYRNDPQRIATEGARGSTFVSQNYIKENIIQNVVSEILK